MLFKYFEEVKLSDKNVVDYIGFCREVVFIVLFYLFSTVFPLTSCVFFPVDLSLLTYEWDDGGKIGKIILTEIFPSVHET